MKTVVSSEKMPLNGKDHNRNSWESRSRFFGASLNGVLFKNLPETLNKHFHKWHTKIILEAVADCAGDPRILDVGCGYGRLSMPIIEKYPSADIVGIDISQSYVNLYRDKTGRPAYVCGIEDLPETLGNFDYIFCVTVLMYLDEQETEKALEKLVRHLKGGGRLILIEPHSSGIPWQTAFGLLKLLKRPRPEETGDTRGRAFRNGCLKALFQTAGLVVEREFRLPASSMLILPLTLICSVVPENWAAKILNVISRTDKVLEGSKLPTLWTAYTIRRPS